MKKLIAVILCCATVLCLVACTEKDEPAATTTETPTTQEATTEQTLETRATIPQIIVETTEATTPKPTIQSMQKKTPKEQFEALAGVVGLSLSDALQLLGWQKTGVTKEEDNLYALPLEVYLSGTKYRLFLCCSEDLQTVNEVLYRSELSLDSMEAAEAALQAVKTVDQWVGEKYELETDGSFALRNTTQEEVAAGLSEDEYAYCAMVWNYSKQVKEAQAEYIKECEKMDFWQNSGRKATLGVSMEVSRLCKKEGDKVISDICRIDLFIGVIAVPAAE